MNERQRGWQGSNWRRGFGAGLPQMIAEVDAIGEDPEMARMIDAGRMRAMLVEWPKDGWDDWEQIGRYRATLFRMIAAARFARFVREWPPR